MPPSSGYQNWKHKKLHAVTTYNISRTDWWVMYFRNVKQSLYLIKHHEMKACEEPEVQLHAFLLLAVSFKLRPVYSRRKRKISAPCGDSSPLSSKQLSHYIYWVILAPLAHFTRRCDSVIISNAIHTSGVAIKCILKGLEDHRRSQSVAGIQR